MTVHAAARPDDLTEIERLMGAAFRLANLWATLALLCQITILFIGAWAPLRDGLGIWAPVVALGVGYLMAIVRLFSDQQKGAADAILRRLELAQGLGRPIASLERADMLADASTAARLLARRLKPAESRPASELPPSPRRAVLTTYESAWWTKRLAKEMVWVETVLIGLVFGVAVLVLRAAQLPAQSGRVTVLSPELLLAIVVFVFTQGPLRRRLDFRNLQEGAARVEGKAERILESAPNGESTESEALSLLAEYQLTRKGSPAIPVLLWRLRRGHLNAVARRSGLPWLPPPSAAASPEPPGD